MDIAMKITSIITFTLFASAAFSQSIERQVIASVGGDANASNIQASYTVGEAVIATGSASNVIVTQGFQQPTVSSVGIEEMDNGLSVNVYPNPVSDNLTVEINATNDLTVNATVYDMGGRATGVSISSLKVNGSLKHMLDVSTLTPGQYFISFTDEQSTLGTVRIQKVR